MENILSTNSFSSKVRGLKVNHDRATEGVLGQKISEQAHAKNDIKKTENTAASIKQQHNASILQANLNFSVSAGNESLALLYKTTIEGINDVLQAEFGDNAIQNAYDSDLDISPEATADRIVSMSTAFFSIYREQNSEMSDEEAAQAFADIIGGGIDTGFVEAREVLDGLSVLEGDIASNIDTTFDLVQKGLLAFVNSYAEAKEDEPA
jgi:hypothetical protein